MVKVGHLKEEVTWMGPVGLGMALAVSVEANRFSG